MERSNLWALRFMDVLNLEVGHKSGHTCTLRKNGRTHIGVGSINSFVASDEVVFKILFCQFCQGK